jgi:phosphoglycerate kinase
MAIQYIDQAEVKDQRVIARFDFNVPLNKETKEITDTSRIDLALPTIKHLLDAGVKKLVLMSHLGRPKGQVNKDFSLEPVATYLAEQLGQEVVLTESAIDNGIKELLTLKDIKIILLENLRFHEAETKNGEEFASKLASYADLYVNDAFGVSHRKHASVHAIHKFFNKKAYAGLLIKKEIEALDKVLNSPEKPFVAIVGGAKVSDKIKTIEKLMVGTDKLLIGGAMAYPFLKSKGVSIGKSLCSDEDVQLAKQILATDKSGKIQLPIDHIVSEDINGAPVECLNTTIEDNMIGLDIGPQTRKNYQDIISSSKTVLWNGPMGLFENADFAQGTMSLADAIAAANSYSLVGGGDSVAAVKKSGKSEQFSHVSTGGGASLEYIEKGELPGIQALKFGV